MLTKKDLERLSELTRIEIEFSKEQNFLKDLEKILKHFEELKEIDTSNVEPMSGGTFSKNVFCQDEDLSRQDVTLLTEQFLDKEKGFLKIPPVFED